jgi:peptide/nickel transport system permease protein
MNVLYLIKLLIDLNVHFNNIESIATGKNVLGDTDMSKKDMGLAWYVVKKLLQGIPMVVAVVILCFVLIKIAPGDPINMMSSGYDPTPEMRAKLEAQWGLDKPVLIQLVTYIEHMLTGDFGYSYFAGKSVGAVIMERIPATLILMFSAIIFSSFFGILAGVLSSRKMYSFTDSAIISISLIGYSAPLFWVGQILILVFSITLGVLPVSGMRSMREQLTGFAAFFDICKHLILPGLTLSFWFMALLIRITRAKMAEVLQADFIKTARAKGLHERKVTIRHALRNAMAPIVTVLGLEFSVIFMGAVVVETVFGWPGTGRLMFDSVMCRDYPMITGMFFVISVSVILVNILVDIIYAIIDPRIRYE